MNKNERNQLVQKYKNQNVLLAIINDLSNNYTNYNKIYINNLLNLTSFYDNLSLVLESLPSKIIFPKIANINLFNDNPSINIIDDFYNYHRKFLNNLQKLSVNIKQKIIPKLIEYKNNLEKENINIDKFMDDIIGKTANHQQKINEYNDAMNKESEKFKKMELDSLKLLSNSSMLEIIHKTLDDQRKKVSNHSAIHQQEIQTLNKLYNENQDIMNKKVFQIKSNYKNNNYTIFESIKEYIKIWNDIIIDNNVNESKKLYEKIDFIEENLNPDGFIDLILINENNKTIFNSKWKYSQNKYSEIFNNENDETNNPHFLRIPKLPYTDIQYDPEHMLILKNTNLDSDHIDDDSNVSISNQQSIKKLEPFFSFFISLRKKKSYSCNSII
jgi:hypothetical protein